MPDKKKILICDDETDRSNEWKDKLELIDGLSAEFDVIAATHDDIKTGVQILEVRSKDMRNGSGEWKGDCIFDQAEILVVDYDLLDLSDVGDFLTGDKIAYFARVFSRVGYIVVVNQFGTNEFDLSLTRDALARADLNIGDIQLSNPGLWRQPFEGFRPWYWPILPTAVRDLGRRWEDLKAHGALEQPILDFLGFRKRAVINRIPSSAAQWLCAGCRDVDKKPDQILADLSFRDFVLHSGVAIDRKDAEAIKDSGRDDILVRVAASVVYKWLERQILVAQDLLIDAPHLIERMPLLLDGDVKSLECWNLTTSLEDPTGVNAVCQKHAFEKTHWLSRPAYWWPMVEDDPDIAKILSSGKGIYPDFVFREDVSDFKPQSDSREFRAEVNGLFNRRFVSNTQARAGAGEDPRDTSNVVYSPSVRLAM